MAYNDYLTDSLVVLCISFGFYLLRSWSSRQKQTYPFPPGPKGLPILGNFFDMIATRECKTLQDLRDIYGRFFKVDSDKLY